MSSELAFFGDKLLAQPLASGVEIGASSAF
jgi:hypothetical protein